MNNLRKNFAIYIVLACAWFVTVAWLAYEHNKVEQYAKTQLLNRAAAISNTIAVLSRSGPPGTAFESRLETALDEMISSKSSELIKVALINDSGEVLVHRPDSYQPTDLPTQGDHWGADEVTVVNLVDWGDEPTIVIPNTRDEFTSDTRRGGDFNRRGSRRDMEGTSRTQMSGGPGGPRDFGPGGPGDFGRGGPPSNGGGFDGPPPGRGMRGQGGRGGGPDDGGRRGIGRIRPWWMSPEQYQEIVRKRGLHGFVLVLSTAAVSEAISRDLLMRYVLGTLTLLALGGLGAAWAGREKSTKLQMRLVRAHELNTHLQEMNIAAAGLAHETRNPLNIVRGLAQLIAQDPGTSSDMRSRSTQITAEVDRVTGRLNEFINYSRPPEPRPGNMALASVVRDVERTLESDSADKQVTLSMVGPEPTVLADESLLRQVLFNLIINAIQAVKPGGKVQVTIAGMGRSEVSLTVEDDGPGVPANLREEIFRPYFTTNAQGSGLGLAVVNQIVLAHHWEIEYVQSQLGGAGFRITGIRTV